jgi:membrane protease YdiL (CAAX protease family)
METSGSENAVTLSKRTVLGISLAVIVLSWIYQISSQRSGQVLPSDFSELVLRIVRDKLIVFVAIFLLLRVGGERFENLGVGRQDWGTHLGMGVVIGFAMFAGLNVAFNSVMNSLIPNSDASARSVASFFKQPANLLIWLPIGIVGGGIVEELQRIFVLTRFEKWLGRPGLIVGVVLTSAIFGFGHLYQGLGTAISTTVSGLVFALVYLRRRSALEPITAHAFSDVLAMLAATMLAR